MHQVPHSPIVSVTRRERAFYEQKNFWYLGTFRADSKVLTLVINIALDEARLWLRRSKNLDHRATRCPRRGATENLFGASVEMA
jgi:hypothetical protein